MNLETKKRRRVKAESRTKWWKKEVKEEKHCVESREEFREESVGEGKRKRLIVSCMRGWTPTKGERTSTDTIEQRKCSRLG